MEISAPARMRSLPSFGSKPSVTLIDEGFVQERAAALGLVEPRSIERLTEHDLHDHARNAVRPLPVWRVRFADAQQTWVHIDGQTG